MRLMFLFIAPVIFFQSSCSNGSSGDMQKPIEMKDLPESFLSFYTEFHKDSAYQMAHIQWPLKGEKSKETEEGGSKKVLYVWEPEEWVVLHEPDMTDVGLKRSFETINDVLVIERLQYPMVNYGLERQFFKEENGEWTMIFYSEMQEL